MTETDDEAAGMSAIEFAGALAALRWTASSVAVWCGYSRQAGAHWEAGKFRVPAQVAAWIDARLDGHLGDPPMRRRL